MQPKSFLPYLVAFFSLAIAQSPPGAAESAPEFPWAESDLEPDPELHYGTLENGLRYVIRPHDEPPERVSLRLHVGSGSVHEDDKQRGLAHFLEHLAFKGSENFSGGELVEFLQNLGMAFGPDTNAHTGFEETVYKLELPENSPDLLDTGLQVLRDYGDQLLLREKDIESERGVILAEKRDRDSVDYRRFVAFWNFLFPESIIPERFPIGNEEVIKNAERPLFLDYYESWYRPGNMVLVAVGEIDPESFEKRIKATFASMKPVEEPQEEPDLGEVVQPDFAAHLHDDEEASKTQIKLVRLQPYDLPPDSRERRIRSVRKSLANSMITQRLARIAENSGSPIIEGQAYAFDYLDFFELSGIEVTTRAEDWREALTVAENELRKALEHGFTQPELDEATANLLANARDAVNEAPTRSSRALSGQIRASIASDRVFTTPGTELELAREATEDITPEAIEARFRELWPDDKRFLFVSGDLEMEKPEKTLESAYRESVAKKVQPPETIEVVDWPYDDFGDPSEVETESYHEELDVRQTTFGNGVRFNFKQTDFESNQVRVAVRVGDGALPLDESEAGLDILAEMTFIRGGLGAYSRDELRRVLAGHTVGSSFSVAADHFRLGGKTTPDDLRLQLQLLAAYLTDPGYREEAFDRAGRRIAERYRELESTIEGVLTDKVRHALADGSFRFGYPPREQLESLGREDVRSFLRPALESGYVEISIVGDTGHDKARDLVRETFGSLAERRSEPRKHPEAVRSVAFPEDGEFLQFGVQSDLPRGLALAVWPTVDMREDISVNRRLNFLSRVLRDRLRRKLRDELGQAYSPRARNNSHEVFHNFGYFQAFNSVDPGEGKQMAELLRDIAAELAEGPVTEEEFKRAREPLLSFLEEYRRENSYWLDRVLFQSQVRPRHLDWARTIVPEYKEMTRGEVETTAARFLQPESSVLIAIEPEKVKTVDPVPGFPTKPPPSNDQPAE